MASYQIVWDVIDHPKMKFSPLSIMGHFWNRDSNSCSRCRRYGSIFCPNCSRTYKKKKMMKKVLKEGFRRIRQYGNMIQKLHNEHDSLFSLLPRELIDKLVLMMTHSENFLLPCSVLMNECGHHMHMHCYIITPFVIHYCAECGAKWNPKEYIIGTQILFTIIKKREVKGKHKFFNFRYLKKSFTPL